MFDNESVQIIPKEKDMNNAALTETEYLEAIEQWDAMIEDIFAPLYEDDSEQL